MPKDEIQRSMPAPCADCPVRDLGTCRPIADPALAAVAHRTARRRYVAGQAILPQGEARDGIGVLVSGRVKIVRMTPDGQEQVLQMLGPGDIVGTPGPGGSDVGAEAATEVRLCWTNRAALDILYRDRPEILRAHFDALGEQLARQRVWMSGLRGRSAVERLAAWLLDASVQGQGADDAVIDLTYCRRDLAGLLDMTVETLCRTLHEVAARGAVELLSPKRAVIRDRRRLEKLAGENGISGNGKATGRSALNAWK